MDSEQIACWEMSTQSLITRYIETNYPGHQIYYLVYAWKPQNQEFGVKIDSICFQVLFKDSFGAIKGNIDHVMNILQRKIDDEKDECIVCYDVSSDDSSDENPGTYCSQCCKFLCSECRIQLIYNYKDDKCPHCRISIPLSNFEISLIRH